MRYGLVLFLSMLAMPVGAASTSQPQLPVTSPIATPAVVQPKAPTVDAPTVAIPAPAPAGTANKPGKLTPAQQLRVTMRLPQVKKAIADLSVDEQRAVLRKAAPPRQKLTDAERAERSKGVRDAWMAKTPAMRAELRQKQLAAWQRLTPADRAYRRERMQEQLKALPEDDRKSIIAPFTVGATANAAPVQ